MNPFHALKDYLLEQMPGAYEAIFVGGKVSRGCFFMLTVAMALTIRHIWLVKWRRDLKGEGFETYQSYSVATLSVALIAPYALVAEVSVKLFSAVTTALLIYLVGLVVIRLFAASSHRRMIQGDVNVAERLGRYTVCPACAAIAVVYAAFGT